MEKQKWITLDLDEYTALQIQARAWNTIISAIKEAEIPFSPIDFLRQSNGEFEKVWVELNSILSDRPNGAINAYTPIKPGISKEDVVFIEKKWR